MTRNLRYLFLFLFVSVANTALAQLGGISGTVVDSKKEPIINAAVEVRQGGTLKGGTVTDYDGNYIIKPLNPGQDYEITVKSLGNKTIKVEKVLVSPEKMTVQDFAMQPASSTVIEEFVVRTYKVPLIDREKPGTNTILTSEQIEKLPTRNTNDAASLSAGAYQQKNGGAISINGARSNGTQYIVDGMQVNGSAGTSFPPGAIDQISVLTSGIPAKYGDASGGIISITTKGPSPITRGDVSFEHSIDGYNHNLAFVNLAGPLFKKKVDSTRSRSVVGYSINAQYKYDEDNNPSYYNNYVVKDDVLANLRQNPLVAKPTAGGTPTLRYASEYVTMDDMETSKKRVNAAASNAAVVGKLDYQVAENANLTLGGSFDYNTGSNYSRSSTLFAPEAIPTYKSYTGRGYIRFTQRFGKNAAPLEEGAKRPTISNAYYSVQADYQVNYSGVEDPNHKRNAFEYGYVGKFTTDYFTGYGIGTDDSTGLTGVKLLGYNFSNGVTYERSEMNPYLANYTSQIYNVLGGALPSSLFEVQQLRGLRNGDEPSAAYGLWSNVGSYLNGYSYANNDQFAFNVDASFDFQPEKSKTKHAIEFGLYYQQRSERGYALNNSEASGTGLWSTARLLANKHIGSLEGKPYFVKNGVTYTYQDYLDGKVQVGPNDTFFYSRRFDTSAQSTFDKNLRAKLNLPVYGTDFIDVDRLDPSLLSINMFSADEILNAGKPIATYYGYDYTGQRINGQVNFNDWFTKKNAQGDYTREIGAFRPNYIAGYIQDRFELPGHSLFSVGVRIERFDANTKVLKDPYSIYAEHTVGDNTLAVNRLNGSTPGNIKSNYVVYVADNTAGTPEIIGYRNGDDWYDPYGKLVSDPTLLKQYSGGRDPQPFLQRDNAAGRALTMRDSAYNPNSSFTDYTPQVNVMPRISFTFPIAEQSMFYAHYDVLVQRPKSVGEILATPADYYYLSQSSTSVIANPDLKPEKTFDYELGFQQALNSFSSVTLTGFYKERKDMIQVRPYLYAWPTTYFTYGNRDFSSTKGIMIKYDMRQTKHLSMLLSYTLQFAEGTASSSTGAYGLLSNFISAQLPNLRVTYPLNVDSRHNINANLDYRFNQNEGPIAGGVHFLQNAGANLIFRARSGEPYTKYQFSNTNVVEGGIEGSRIPWHYMMDLRIDKKFNLSFKKKALDGLQRKPDLGITAFIYITNLLNTRDVLSVYGFTGRPDDNGYLASPQGQLAIQTAVYSQAYADQYTLATQDPNNINNPRRINLGLSLNF